MDEGWTRFVLEEHGFVPMRITNTDVRAGRLVDRIDVLVIASMSTDAIANGQGRDRTAPEFVGGLGADAVLALRDFVTAGGTLICLENSCKFAIDRFGLPVESVLDRLQSKVFYCPGSILRAEATRLDCSFAVDPALGMPDEFSIYFDRSLAFESKSDLVVTHARYAAVNPLESGWLLGSSKLEGKSALVSVAVGQGRIVLFGFPPQHRGQTHGTYPLLFRAILQDSF
jgi:hypothetical protein